MATVKRTLMNCSYSSEYTFTREKKIFRLVQLYFRLVRAVVLLIGMTSVSCMRPNHGCGSTGTLFPQDLSNNLVIWGMNTWGYIDASGDWSISPQFTSASVFADDIA